MVKRAERYRYTCDQGAARTKIADDEARTGGRTWYQESET